MSAAQAKSIGSQAARFAQVRAASSAPEVHKVALVGFGTVGKGFCEIIEKKQSVLSQKYGMQVEVVAVSDFKKGSVYCPDGLNVSDLLKWDEAGKPLGEFSSGKSSEIQHGWDALKTCKDTNADHLLEVAFTNLDNGQPAIEHVETAVTNGKNVITTNKGPCVFAYDKLDKLARENERRFMIEGSIMSGTPIVSLMKAMPAAEYTEISGILNGTCNYMLTSMEQDGVEYDAALKEAQRLGYAEANPSFDVGGGDARAKAIILTKILGVDFDTDKIELVGIEGITKQMVEDAAAEKKRWKLVSQLLFKNGGTQVDKISVKPMKLDIQKDSLANVGGALNALNFKGDMLGGDLTMIGPGAGRIETGYSLFTDMMYLAGADRVDP